MSGISRLAAITIATSFPKNIVIHTTQSVRDGKFRGWIDLTKNDNFHSQLLSTEEIYNTEDEAKSAMKEICEWCMNWCNNEFKPTKQ